jgi:hypothetical protein
MSERVTNGVLWTLMAEAAIGGKEPKPVVIVVECERWFDVRAVVEALFGHVRFERTAEIPASWKNGHAPPNGSGPDIQIRWVGSAAGANTLRREHRVASPTLAKALGVGTEWTRIA